MLSKLDFVSFFFSKSEYTKKKNLLFFLFTLPPSSIQSKSIYGSTYMPSTALNAENIALNKRGKNLYPFEAQNLVICSNSSAVSFIQVSFDSVPSRNTEYEETH